MYRYLLPILWLGLVFTFPRFVLAADVERGKLLYENHCMSCHESVVHIRNDRRTKALGELYWQTTRWAIEQGLEWRYDEVRDVAQYLNARFYQFDERLECK